MTKVRGFEVCKGFEDQNITLPFQATEGSAGYDFCAAADIMLGPAGSLTAVALVPTGVKAYMKDDEVLELHIRSSMAYKNSISLANSTGIVDASYYSNSDNDGHIMFMLRNSGRDFFKINKGDRIGQGIFKKYLYADTGNSNEQRTGGFGSTGN